MNIPIRLRNAFVFALLLVSVLIPAKMGMGQRYVYRYSWGSQGSSNEAITRPGMFLLLKDGTVLVNNSSSSANILRLSTSGDVLGTISSTGVGPGQVRFPTGMAQLSNGDILVADVWAKKVLVFDLGGTFKYDFNGVDGVHSPFGAPHGVCVDRNDNVYVVGENAGIWVYRPDGTYVRHWSTTQYGVWIEDVVQGADGHLYVSFPNGLGVVVMTTNGEYVRTIDGTLTGGPKLTGPIGLRFDKSGLLFVTDTLAPKIRVFTPDGQEVASFGEAGTGVTKISRPIQSQPLPNGTVLVSEENNSTILVFQQEETPPSSTLTTAPSSTWSNSDVTATITSTDNAGGSGVKEIHYSVNMGAEQVVIGSSASFTLSENGVHSITFYAIDNAGNTETTQYATVRIDKTRPTVDAYAIGSLVTVIAQDTVSGVVSTKVSIDGAAAVDYTGSFSVPVGAHTVTYWATDQAGNESTREVILVGVTVSSVAVAPTTLFSTKAGVGTVKLSLAAPAGGVVVMLDSNSPAVTVPVSVTVPAGALTATFTATAGTVATDTKAVISASVGGQEVHGTVYVLVPYPKTLTLAPTTIIGGDAGMGTITLASIAGTGGQVVNLSSSNSNVVVPSTVTVPSGALTVTFPIQTSIVGSDIAVAISAEADGAGISSTLLVKRVAPKSITFAPASVIGGNSSVATLTVTKPAPAGGIVVDLRSVSSNVTVPATVTIPAGATTATFPVTTVPIKKSESAMIQAYAAGVKVSANITVTATSVTAIALNPTSVVGGFNSTATVTLNGNAPVGGTTVQLYSTNANASVPVSVTIPAGTKTVTFPVTTVAVAANTTASIAVKYQGTTKSATLTIAAPTVNTLSLLPSSLTGGATSKMTIKLTGKAGVGGVLVTLTSSNMVVAQIPASVTVPAGADTVDVNIQTAAVAATTNVTLTAKTGAVAKTAVLTVNK